MGSSLYSMYPLCIVGAYAGIYFFISVVKKQKYNTFISFWGKNTLILYCVHSVEHNFIPWTQIKDIFEINSVYIVDIVTLCIRCFIVFSVSYIVIVLKKVYINRFDNTKTC